MEYFPKCSFITCSSQEMISVIMRAIIYKTLAKFEALYVILLNPHNNPVRSELRSPIYRNCTEKKFSVKQIISKCLWLCLRE